MDEILDSATAARQLRENVAPWRHETTSATMPADARCARSWCDLQAAQLAAPLQGETPLILPTVDDQAVASVVADWTGIPVGRMVKNEIDTVLNLADTWTSASSARTTPWR